jgi:hypothetical protein
MERKKKFKGEEAVTNYFQSLETATNYLQSSLSHWKHSQWKTIIKIEEVVMKYI